MSLRRFLSSVLGLTQPEPVHADPVRQAEVDAYALLDAIYAGEPWSRRAWERRMGQSRWQRATHLLRSVDLLDRRGRFLWQDAPAQETAEVLVREGAQRMRARQRHKNYVSPRG